MELKEARWWYENAANMPACSSHGSEARIEGKGVGEAVEEGKKVRGFRGNHTKITETCLVRRAGHHLQAWRIDLQFDSIRKVGSGTRIGVRNACGDEKCVEEMG